MNHLFSAADQGWEYPPHADLACSDWEYVEALAREDRTAACRIDNLNQAASLAPRLELSYLALDCWLARIVPSPEWPDCSFVNPDLEGAYQVRILDPKTMFFRSQLSEERLWENLSLLFLPF